MVASNSSARSKERIMTTGSISRVKLTNFMSYDGCEFFPGPRLNMVIGPNGSGKSTIVCALALGLGGTPKLLQRAKEIRSFVKSGKEKAMIEIELVDHVNGPQVIQRHLNSESNQTSYFWNGKKVAEKTVRDDLKAKYSCQVDNLCQFLPQDKVSFFSSLDPKELLTETIRVGLGEEYVTEQDRLVTQREELRRKSTNAEEERKTLETKEAELKKLQDRVDAMRERQKTEELIKHHKDKIKYVEFDIARDKYNACKQEVKEIKQVIPKMQADLDKVLEEEKAHKDNLKALVASAPKEDRNANKNFNKVFDKLEDKAKESLVDLNETSEDITELFDGRRKMLNKLKKAEKDVKTANASVAKWEAENSVEDLQQQKASLTLQLNKLKSEKGTVKGKHDKLSTEFRLAQKHRTSIQTRLDRLLKARDSKEAILSKLGPAGRQGKEIWHAVMENQNAGKFKGKVYLAATEVKPKSDLAAIYLERALNPYQLCTIVTQNEQDSRTCMKIRRASVFNVMHYKDITRKMTPQDMKRFGIKGYLDQLIDGPKEVIQAFRSIGSLHKILVGTHETEVFMSKMDDETFRKLFLGMRIFTPSTRFVVKSSRYSNNVMTTTQSDNPNSVARYFKAGKSNHDDSGQLAEMERQKKALSTSMAAMNTDIMSVEKIMDGLSGEIKQKNYERSAISENVECLRRLKNNVNVAKRTYERLKEKSCEDSAVELKKLYKEHRVALQKIASVAEGNNDKINEYLDTNDRTLQLQIAVAAAKARKSVVEFRKANMEVSLKEAQHELAALSSKAKELKLRAKELGAIFKDANANEEVIGALTNDLHELKTSLRMLKAQLNNYTDDKTVLARYEELLEEVKKLRPLVENFEDNQQKLTEEYNAKLAAWKETVASLLDNISQGFEHSFASVRDEGGYECAGKVGLKLVDDNIKEAGVEIKIRFRAEQPLQPLNVKVQSGGERSFTTFMYLLALNKMCKAPFRVVDEINQGMDAEKERMSFAQLVNACCGDHPDDENVSQYFLITPKLLTGLKYHRDIKFHIIFNGPGALPQNMCSFSKMLQLKRNGGSKRIALEEPEESSPKKRTAR